MQHKQAHMTLGSDPIAVTGQSSAMRRWLGLRPRRRLLSLALQGGGSFGAFTWGVLDHLLETEGVAFDAVSGTSAGAVNAVVLANGLAQGGPSEARRQLAHLWKRLSRAAPLASLGSASATSAAIEFSTRVVSPYQFNPLGVNLLRDILVAEVDFARLRKSSPVRLLIAATRVSDGRVRIFREHEITLEAVLASACLPHLHHAVEIDGEWYWDGAFSANPPLRQLVADSRTNDIVLVQIAPEQQAGLPRLSSQIARRAAQPCRRRRFRGAVEPQRQAEGRAAAAQERAQRRADDTIAARLETAAQAGAARRQHDGVAEADRVGGEPARILLIELDAQLRRHARADLADAGGGEGAGEVHDLALAQRAERRVHMIKARIGQLERYRFEAEIVLDGIARRQGRARAMTHPEQPARAVPDAVAGALEHQPVRQMRDAVDVAARLQLEEGALEIRLLAAAFGMAKARQQRLAIHHDGRIRGEDEVGQIRHRPPSRPGPSTD